MTMHMSDRAIEKHDDNIKNDSADVLVSVVLPCLNEYRTLKICITEIMNTFAENDITGGGHRCRQRQHGSRLGGPARFPGLPLRSPPIGPSGVFR